MRKIIHTTDGDYGFMALADDGTVWRLESKGWVMEPELPIEPTDRQRLQQKRELANHLWAGQYSSLSYPVKRKALPPGPLQTEAEIDAWIESWQTAQTEGFANP